MVRKNDKQQVTSYENCIRKSNELSMAKLNKGLTLNQMQLLAFAIFSTQQNGETEFNKAEFEKKFGLSRYLTEDAYKDSQRVLSLQVSTQDLENNKFKFWNALTDMEYDKGHFSFKWHPKMIPHILELKEKYVTTDLTVTSNFKSGFSWTLYDYLKAHYGYWHKPLSKETLLQLFSVENRKTYQTNTGRLKKTVLDVAIDEINKYTEFEVWYKEEKKGRSIVGFDLIWSTGTNQASATKKQIKELTAIVDIVHDEMFKYINLHDDEKRNQAIVLVRQTESMKLHTEEPICITKERADKLLVDADYALKELERLAEKDKKGEFYYNWLEK